MRHAAIAFFVVALVAGALIERAGRRPASPPPFARSMAEAGAEIFHVQRPSIAPVVMAASSVPPAEVGALQRLIGADPAAALLDLAEQPDCETVRMLVRDACLALSEDDPARAVRLAAAFEFKGEPADDVLLRRWAEADLAAAIVWTHAQPPSATRDRAVVCVAEAWARVDPVDASEWLLAEVPAGPVHDEAVMAVLHQWTLHDPSAAKAWAETFSLGPLRNRALREVAGLVMAETSSR